MMGVPLAGFGETNDAQAAAGCVGVRVSLADVPFGGRAATAAPAFFTGRDPRQPPAPPFRGPGARARPLDRRDVEVAARGKALAESTSPRRVRPHRRTAAAAGTARLARAGMRRSRR